MIQYLWQFEMFGTFRASSYGRTVDRFRTQKTATLLARLALKPGVNHSRDVLIDMLWPESDLDAGRTNLRVAANSLRRQLEPPGVPFGSVLTSTRDFIRINTDAVHVDALHFETTIRAADSLSEPRDTAEALCVAAALYHGKLLPSLYDDWVLNEQERLASLYQQTMRRLVALCSSIGEHKHAVDYAYRALQEDPLSSPDQVSLLQALVASNQIAQAQRHYEKYASEFADNYGSPPAIQFQAILNTANTYVPEPTSPRVATSATPGKVLAASANRIVRDNCTLPIPHHMIGRDELADEVTTLVQSPGALVTLTGSGGIGKTTLAVHIAHRLAAAGCCVIFVPLADIDSADGIMPAIARVLGESPDSETIGTCLANLSEDAPVLIVLDNFEHLMPHGVAVLRELMRTAPRAALLITSRHRPGILTEHVIQVPTLPLPENLERAAPELRMEQVTSIPSVALFVQRAQSIRGDFQVTNRNLPDIVALCRSAQGVPLAIELAASWSRVLTPGQMVKQFQLRGNAQESRTRGISDRHRSLPAAIDWSYRLLSAEMKQLLQCASIFHGGLSLEALEAVVASTDMKSGRTLELLAELIDRSLIVATEEPVGATSQMRYRMLDSIRSFVVTTIAMETYAHLRAQHATWYLDFADRMRQGYDTGTQSQVVANLSADRQNLYRALEWYLETEPENALKLCVYLNGMWYMHRLDQDAIKYLHAALDREPNRARTPLRAWALNILGMIEGELLRTDAADVMYLEALDIRMEIGAPGPIGASLNSLGNFYYTRHRYLEALDYFRRALQYMKAAERWPHVCTALRNIGLAQQQLGDLAGAEASIRESLEISRTNGFAWGEMDAIGSLGMIFHFKGEHSLARECYERHLEYLRINEVIVSIPAALGNLARLCVDTGDLSAAKLYFREGVVACAEHGEWLELTILMEHAAKMLFSTNPVATGRLLGATQSSRKKLDAVMKTSEADAFTALVERVRSKLGEAEFNIAYRAGELLPIEEAARSIAPHFSVIQ